MSFKKIITILTNCHFVNNWELDDDNTKLCIYYKNYNLTLFFDDNIYYIILTLSLNINPEQEEIIQKLAIDLYKKFFFENKKIYIQSRFKYKEQVSTYEEFIKDIILEQQDLYNEINYCLKTYNTKKNIFIYPHKNINKYNIFRCN